MPRRIEQLAEEIVRLQGELDREIERRRADLGWRLNEGLLEFEHGITQRHRQLRLGARAFMARSDFATVITAPLIYSLIVPVLLIDAWASLYQAVCFRAYRIPRVRRSSYIVMDRDKLGYLNAIEALNCFYCEYANGVVAYVREISSRTEQYWCPIKHALAVTDPHLRYYQFLEYGEPRATAPAFTSFASASGPRLRTPTLRRSGRHPRLPRKRIEASRSTSPEPAGPELMRINAPSHRWRSVGAATEPRNVRRYPPGWADDHRLPPDLPCAGRRQADVAGGRASSPPRPSSTNTCPGEALRRMPPGLP